MKEKLIPVVDQVFKKMNKENEFGMHQRTVEELAGHLDMYSFATIKEEKLALLYACRIYCEISNHIMQSFGVNKDRYYLYNTVEYIVRRVMIVMGDRTYPFKPIETDEYLESKVSFIENNLIIERNKGKPNNKVYSLGKK